MRLLLERQATGNEKEEILLDWIAVPAAGGAGNVGGIAINIWYFKAVAGSDLPALVKYLLLS